LTGLGAYSSLAYLTASQGEVCNDQTGTLTITFDDGSGTIVVNEVGVICQEGNIIEFFGDNTSVQGTGEYENLTLQCGEVEATVILNNDSAVGTVEITPCPEPPPKPRGSSSGGDDSWPSRPTSGPNHLTGDIEVTNGVGVDGNFWTVYNEYYQPSDGQLIKFGERTEVVLKVKAPNRVQVTAMLVGYDEVGGTPEAELRATLNYDGEIEKVEVIQKTDVFNPETVTLTKTMVNCTDQDQTEDCYEFTWGFEVQEQIPSTWSTQNIDFKKRVDDLFHNHGFELLGDPINPMLTKMIPSTVKYEGLIEVTQIAKYSPYWVTDDHRMFEMNSFGSFKQINHSFERFQDTGTAYTRMHSGFGGIIAYEQDRALDIFDASNLVSELPESFAYIFPETGERITEEMREAMLLQEQIAQQVLDEMYKQDRHH